MPNIYQFNEIEIMAFFLVLIRLSSFIFAWPVFGEGSVPSPVKILFSLSLSMMLFPVVSTKGLAIDFSSYDMVWLSLREAFIGLSIGFLARMFFFAVRISAEVMATSMGLASAQLFDPHMGGQTTTLEQLKLVLASLIFLGIQGHHFFLMGLVDSFRLLPLAGPSLSFNGFLDIGSFAQEIMEMGIKMCSPIMISILFMNVAMAVIGRAVPQINVLITSLPVNILVGFLILIIGLPLMIWQMQELVEITASRVFQIMKTY